MSVSVRLGQGGRKSLHGIEDTSLANAVANSRAFVGRRVMDSTETGLSMESHDFPPRPAHALDAVLTNVHTAVPERYDDGPTAIR